MNMQRKDESIMQTDFKYRQGPDLNSQDFWSYRLFHFVVIFKANKNYLDE